MGRAPYVYLANLIDYDILNDDTVLISYMFGKDFSTNNVVAEKGFDCTYFVKDWLWSPVYQKYRKRLNELQEMNLKLHSTPEAKGDIKMEKTLKEVILQNLPPAYWPWIIFFGLGIRLIMSVFKAFAICQGEADYVDEITKQNVVFRDRPWKEAFWITLKGFSKGPSQKTIDDYWLTVFIGMSELYLYPILMVVGKWSVIGTWLAIKTASGWGTWQKSRTTYSRFLFGNILALFSSLLLLRFVKY